MIENEQVRAFDNAQNSSRRYYIWTSWCALIVTFIYAFSGVWRELSFSMKQFSPIQGMANSPWVGMENFSRIMALPEFGSIIRSTISYTLLYAVLGFVIVALGAYVLLALPTRVRHVLAVLGVLPLFVSVDVYGNWLLLVFSGETFLNAGVVSWLFPLFSVFKTAGIAWILLVALHEWRQQTNQWFAVKIAALYGLAGLVFAGGTSLSLGRVLQNPLNREGLENLELYAFRIGFIMADFSNAAAATMIQLLISMIALVIVAVPMWLIIRSLFNEATPQTINHRPLEQALTVIIALVIFTVIYHLPGWIQSVDASPDFTMPASGTSIFSLVLVSLLGAFFAVLLASLLAGSLFVPKKGLAIAALVMLSLITLFTSQSGFMSTFMTIRSMNLLNTMFAVMLVSMFSAGAIWGLAAVLRMEKQWTVWVWLKAVAGLFLIQAALIYANSFPHFLYLMDATRSPYHLFSQLQGAMQTMPEYADRKAAFIQVVGFGYWVSFPALVLFALAYVLLPRAYGALLMAGGLKR